MTALDKAFEEVSQLVKKFTANLAHYMSPGYSEAEARQDFIDNFFKALGWDVSHKHQTNPYEQEVKIERSQKQQNESARKRADYAFFINPNYKDEVFFAEAKKPSVLIQNNPQHYFQTIKYGWNSGCPICVLTDFEEFVIVDCRQKPDIKYALNGKHETFRYTDYTNKEKFAEIYWLFSREAVAGNSIKKYADALPKPKGKVVQKALFKGGYQAIDDSFLEYIDGIRENIAKAFKKANPELNSEQLTEATQRTVDRLVFIRFLEDKFIEAAEHVSEWQSWKDFITDCRKLDAKYNGVVFKKHFIDEPHFIGADEKLFLDICSDISNLNSPYDFNYIPIHILGSIYERFLGKIVRATDKRVFIEEKPEVRKAGGVYYTPKYIVDYIVKNTVGKIIDGLIPKQIAEKRFADIACGSGSFLIGVYDYLLDYHKKYYTEKLNNKTEIDARSEDYGNTEYKDGQWLLTLKLKQEILLNNIYGVDIDAQAVEVTQLSLFLKMLDEENVSSTATKQGALFSKVLPDLSKNIVCGNSLIGFDIMQGQLFEDEELKKLNPMDYETAFPAIMRNGGFDAVVGNPPYVRPHKLEEITKNFLWKKYSTYVAKSDLYSVFMQRGLELLKGSGLLCYIVPQTWTSLESFVKIRELYLYKTSVLKLVQLPKKVFRDATVETCIFLVRKNIGSKPTLKNFIEVEKINTDTGCEKVRDFPQADIESEHLYNFQLQKSDSSSGIIKRIKTNSISLGELVDFVYGFKTGDDEKFISNIKKNAEYKPCIRSADIFRYYHSVPTEFVWYNPKLMIANKKTARPGDKERFEKEKILVSRMGKQVIASFDNGGLYVKDAMLLVKKKDFSLVSILGILNSKLINYYYKEFFITIDVLKNALLSIPIPIIDFNNKSQKHLHDQLVTLVTQMLESKKQLAAAVTDGDKNFLQNKCSSIDRQIDKLVYELYELTEEEIKIVEGL